MRTLLLTVARGLIAALQAQDPRSFQEPEILGTWFVKAIVGDRALPAQRASPITISVLSGGRLQPSLTHTANGQCQAVAIVLEKTNVPGRYSAFGGKSHLHVEGMPVKDHLVFYCEGQFKGDRFRAAKLMSRNPDVNPEALDAFKKFVQRRGLSPEDIFTPEQTESCDPESD